MPFIAFRRLRQLLLPLLLAGGFSSAAGNAADQQAKDYYENLLYMDLESGRVVIQMRPDLAPRTVNRIRELTRAGFYDGRLFFRVEGGTLVQTGSPSDNGFGGSGQTLPAEFTDAPYNRGSVGMARGEHINSADSQFFIALRRIPGLDGQYTLWGEVVSGMEHLDRLKAGDPQRMGLVAEKPDRLVRLTVATDAQDRPKGKEGESGE